MELSWWQLFFHASAFVKGVMLVLFCVSVISWALIFARLWFFHSAQRLAAKFEDVFWSGVDFKQLYKQQQTRPRPFCGLSHLFHAGFKTFFYYSEFQGVSLDQILSSASRSIDVALAKEDEAAQTHLSWFATIASVSPYIGLLGTVWGIMHSFISLGSMQQVTISMVAPGIAEALIATAMGLLTAIPANIAYNHFATQSQGLQLQYTAFKEEVLNILQRQWVAKKL